MRKSSLPWRYALSGLVAITMMAPATASAAPAGADAPQASATSAKRTVTGTVVDAVDGEPLPGATVSVIGDKNAVTATDLDGNFSIQVSNNKAVLLVTYVGYKEAKAPVDDLGFIKIEMKGDDRSLNEVVVVGAGTQKRVSVSGAITSVKGDDLRMPSTTLTNSLAGKIAGVVAVTNSGEPGSGAEFYIRGIGTFGGKATPLILLDDVEVSSNDLNFIPPENIESFSILKDASATAIYGARGANGVMIVKTKGGDYNAKTTINVGFENSFNFLDKFPEFVDGATYMEMHNLARRSRNMPTDFSQTDIEYTRSGVNPYLYPSVDWSDVIFKRMAMRQRANVNVSGGGSKAKYYMSIDFQHEDGMLNTEKLYSWNNNIQIYNYTFQNNISYKVTPTTTVSMNINAQIRQNTGPNINSQDLFNYILTTTPIAFPTTYPAKPGDEYVRYGSKQYSEHVLANPYAVMNTSFKQYNENTINAVVKLNQELDFITKGLKLQAWVNFKNWSATSFNRSVSPYYFTYRGNREKQVNTPAEDLSLRSLKDGTVYISESDITRSSDQTFEFQAFLNWDRTFAGVHNVGAMVRYHMREYRNVVLPNRNQGISARLTYDFAHRYMLEFNCGYNGTERLEKGSRFGFFPAASAAWVISNESFFEPAANVITNLKIRGSYGLVGSDELAKPNDSYFLYIDKIAGLNSYSFNAGDPQGSGSSGGGPKVTYYYTPGIGWEKVKKADVGIDLTLWGDLSIVADFFLDKRYDIFMQRASFPASLGYGEAKPWGNLGTMENKGFEASIDYNKRINQDWAVSFRGTFTYTQNKTTEMDEPNYPFAWQNKTGLPVGSGRIDGYIAEGLFTSQEEIDNSPKQDLGSQVMVGDIKYRDLNGDGLINSQDQTMISEYGRLPRIQYGFGGTVNWKKFDFGFQFTGSAQRRIMMNGIDPFREGRPAADAQNVLQFIADNCFDPENPDFNAEYPLLGTRDVDVKNNQVNSTYWMRDGSFLRLRNVELGWTFPYGRVYVCGSNLVTFSPFKLWDPELKAWNAYPMSKSVTVGVKLTI